MQLNDMQKAVVEYTPGDGALLVTAAAGSGKTAVVCERVYRLITDQDAPIDITRLLIITFTNAAAEEMRARISQKIREGLRKSPGSRTLSRQIKLLNNADITTIDSFFLKIVRSHFSTLGISPEAVIADPTETRGIAEQVLNDLLEEKYAEGSQRFLRLSDMLSRRHEDKALSELILKAHETLRSMSEPKKRLHDMVVPYLESREKSNNPWRDFLLERIAVSIKRNIEQCKKAISIIHEDSVLDKAYGASFRDDLVQMNNLLSLSGNWDALGNGLKNISFLSLGRLVKYQDEALKLRLQEIRKSYKDVLKKYAVQMDDTEADMRADISLLTPVMEELEELVTAFGKRFLEEKTKRKILEFDDVTQYVYGLMWRRSADGRLVPTREAETLSTQYDEVIVDEYQDTNRLQDEIFYAFTNQGRNLLMVGDVKQSIYGFRYAEPESFMEKLKSYAPLAESKKGNRRQALNLNYRSSKGVIDGVNYLFRHLMKKEFGGIDYDREQELVVGRENTLYHPTELRLVTNQGGESNREEEAQQVALYIQKAVNEGMLIDSEQGRRPVTYGDFAILMRSAKNKMPIYERALHRAGIPVCATRAPGLYTSPEGELVLSFLWVIDNPYHDVALLAVLSSAAIGFTPGELAQIRLCDRKAPFISALRISAQQGDTKSRSFVELLQEWRLMRSHERLGTLIRSVYDKLSLPILAQQSENGQVRVANLYAIAQRAEGFEGKGGLSAFLKATARSIENGTQPDGAIQASSNREVTLMTIHQSKGLQFPIVLLVDTVTSFNTRELTDPVIFQKKMGFGFRMQNREKGIRYDTMTYHAVKCCAEDAQKEEELRMLYVALTRAKEKNVVFITWEAPEKKIREIASQVSLGTITQDHNSYAKWIIACLLYSEEGDRLQNELGLVPSIHNEKSGMVWSLNMLTLEEQKLIKGAEDREKEEAGDFDVEGLKQIYPYEYAVNIKPKITATEIKDSAKNPELFEEAQLEQGEKKAAEKRPAFMATNHIGAAERGSLIHLALQLIRIDQTEDDRSIHAEFERMVKEGFLPPESMAVLKERTILWFFSSPLGKRLKKAQTLYRELKFTLIEDAGLYEEKAEGKDESILLQGIIDCAFEEEGEYVLIDYKSDYIASEQDIAAHILLKGYDKQLTTYKGALARMTGKKVKEGWICFLTREQAVRLF